MEHVNGIARCTDNKYYVQWSWISLKIVVKLLYFVWMLNFLLYAVNVSLKP